MALDRVVRAVAVCTLLVVPQRGALAQNAALPAQLQGVRTSLDKYNDPIVAVHDGYLSTVGCIDFPKGASEGSMRYAPAAWACTSSIRSTWVPRSIQRSRRF
ncbi:MAG: hypothetical protein ACREOG_16805 [Gemmatimonadaceae bacterium]